jgi:hypothetical protein
VDLLVRYVRCRGVGVAADLRRGDHLGPVDQDERVVAGDRLIRQ